MTSMKRPHGGPTLEFQRWQLSRKVAYRNYLDTQLKDTQHKKKLHFDEIKQERQQVQKMEQQLKHQISEERCMKMKTQQKYRSENEVLSKEARSKASQRDRQVTQHPLIRLVDQQEQRDRLWRSRREMQNHENQLNSQLHNKQKQYQRDRDYREKQIFENYVQQQFLMKETQRKRFQDKYLKISPSQASIIKQLPKTSQLPSINVKTSHQSHQRNLTSGDLDNPQNIAIKEPIRQMKSERSEFSININPTAISKTKCAQNEGRRQFLGFDVVTGTRKKYYI